MGAVHLPQARILPFFKKKFFIFSKDYNFLKLRVTPAATFLLIFASSHYLICHNVTLFSLYTWLLQLHIHRPPSLKTLLPINTADRVADPAAILRLNGTYWILTLIFKYVLDITKIVELFEVLHWKFKLSVLILLFYYSLKSCLLPSLKRCLHYSIPFCEIHQFVPC